MYSEGTRIAGLKDSAIDKAFDFRMLCPKCKDSYMKVIVVHTKNSNVSHSSYDMKCEKCGYLTWVAER